MEIEDYKSNSYKSKEEPVKAPEAKPKQVKKVISGSATVQKKGVLEKARDTFIPEDLGKVKEYIRDDVVVPYIKKAIDDIVSNGIHMLLYGSAASPSRKNSPVSHVSYGDYYSSGNRQPAPVSRGAYNYDDIILDSRGDAELVLDQMNELIDIYGEASISDLYECVGITSEYTTNDYGWTNLRSASIARTPQGYLIRLPRAIPLKR